MQRILRRAQELGDQHKADNPVAPRWATLLVLGLMVLTASILGFYAGGHVGQLSDAPDHLSCVREMVERDRILPRTAFFAALPMAAPRSGNAATLRTASAIARGLLGSMRSPVTPLSTASPTPPTSVATTGSPAAIPSSTVSGAVSDSDGRIRRSAAPRICGTSSRRQSSEPSVRLSATSVRLASIFLLRRLALTRSALDVPSIRNSRPSPKAI